MEDKTSSFKPVKRRRFNVIDFIILAAVVLLILTFLFSKYIFSKKKGDVVKLEYTVIVEGVSEEFLDKVKIGDAVYDSSTNAILGYVKTTDEQSRFAVYEYDSAEEKLVAIEYPDRYNLKVTVSSDAEYVKSVGYSVNGRRIAVGGALNLRFPNYVASVYCVGINTVD